MKKNVLYSSSLHIFMLLLTPSKWLFFLPVNLIITGFALYFACKLSGYSNLFARLCKKELFFAFAAGIAGDLAGAGVLLGLCSIPAIDGGVWASTMHAVQTNPFVSTNSLIVIFLAIIIAAAVKYLLDLWISLRKTDMPLKDKRMLCMCLAMFSAPYSFLLPAALLRFLI